MISLCVIDAWENNPWVNGLIILRFSLCTVCTGSRIKRDVSATFTSCCSLEARHCWCFLLVTRCLPCMKIWAWRRNGRPICRSDSVTPLSDNRNWCNFKKQLSHKRYETVRSQFRYRVQWGYQKFVLTTIATTENALTYYFTDTQCQKHLRFCNSLFAALKENIILQYFHCLALSLYWCHYHQNEYSKLKKKNKC